MQIVSKALSSRLQYGRTCFSRNGVDNPHLVIKYGCLQLPFAPFTCLIFRAFQLMSFICNLRNAGTIKNELVNTQKVLLELYHYFSSSNYERNYAELIEILFSSFQDFTIHSQRWPSTLVLIGWTFLAKRRLLFSPIWKL